MSNYKWCICDMDGTLLNSQDMISEENEAALKKLQESGVEVMIASGRLDLLVKRYVHQLDLKGYVISCNGGLIRSLHTGEIIYSNAMNKNTVQEILTYCMDKNIHFLVYTTHVMFSSNHNPRVIRYENINKDLPEILRFEVRYLTDAAMDDMEEMDILKVLLICDNQEQVAYLINKFSKFDSLTVVSSAKGLVDIMASGTSKGKALKILADKYKVNAEDIIAFGDNYNDIELLKSVGLPIAMENSVDELKAVAKYITKSNDESGIAYAVKHYIL